MHIQHLSHSGFLIEDAHKHIIFDPIIPIKMDKETIFMISHSHHDHFIKEILPASDKNIYYIISKDVAIPMLNNVYILDNYESLDIGDIHIKAYGTTDLGNSYLVCYNKRKYFHCGDLNWWHWQRMTKKELKLEETNFKKELERLKGENIDFAFIPVDPRLKEHAYLAINYFIDYIEPRYVIPMHSFGDYGFYKDLEDHLELKNSILLNVNRENEIIFSN